MSVQSSRTESAPRPSTESSTSETLAIRLERSIAWATAVEDFHQSHGLHGSLNPTLFENLPLASAPTWWPALALPWNEMRYISPEQAGRLATIDMRSDIYSLGAILHELFVGEPVFECPDALSIIHSHMAVRPIPLHEIDGSIPPALSGIVLKLLEKRPEARYASCAGLIDDLKTCQDELQKTGAVSPFPLGVRDRRSQFLIPDKLYGREKQIEILNMTLNRSIKGEIVLCMVGGYSGIGKTTLVRAMRDHILEKNGRMVEGKFDQYHREVPYSALIEAFRSLIRQVLAGTREEVEDWRQRVLNLLGENARIVTDVLPEMERLIGEQPPAPELSDAAAQQRFNFVFSELLKLFACKERPLVMFLDDLQWVDFASLALIRTFVRHGRGACLLMVGAYRDNEVGESHPLFHTLTSLREENAPVFEFTLGTLDLEHIQQLIADTCAGLDSPGELANQVMRKTQGNPFFARQFLKSMVIEGTLYFDYETDAWRWRPDDTSLTDVSDNVVDLMMHRLSLQSDTTRQALKFAACIGKRFDLQLLAKASGMQSDDALMSFVGVLQDELLIPIENPEGQRQFLFSHDRVQQAAYSQAIGGRHDQIHLKIGMTIWSQAAEEDLDASVFNIVDQLNKATHLITEVEQRIEVARLNLRAGQRARTSMAYTAARSYLEAAVGCLAGIDYWRGHYELSHELHLELVQIYSLLNEEQPFQETVAELLTQVRTDEERLEVRMHQTAHLCLSSRLFEGLRIGCLGLSEIGIDVPPQEDADALRQAFFRTLENFRRHTKGVNLSERLYDLPMATDRLSEKILKLIGAMGDAATITNTPLLSLLSVIGASRSLQHGNTPLSPLMYTLLGQGVIAHEKAYHEGRDLAQVAIRLTDEKLLDLWSYGRSRVHQFWFILHWSRHLEISLPQIEDALSVTRRAHDPLYSAYLLNIAAITHYTLGRSMDVVLAAHERVVQHCRPYSMDVIIGFTQCYAGAAAALRGETESLTTISGEHVDEQQFFDTFREMPMIMGLNLGATTPLYAYAGEWEKVLEMAADPNLEKSPPFVVHTVTEFWAGVAAARLIDRNRNAAPQTLWSRLARSVAFLEDIHDRSAPDNVRHRLLFLKAERFRVRNDREQATRHYEEAIEEAAQSGYVIERAYFQESFANWRLDCFNDLAVATELLERASSGYRSAQAFTLSQRVRGKIDEIASSELSLDRLTELDAVDTLAILKATNAISRNVALTPLLNRLLEIIMEFSGAERGAIVKRDGNDIVVELSRGEKLTGLPKDFIRYVLNTSETTMLSEPGLVSESQSTGDFSSESYFTEFLPASVFCQTIDRRTPIRRALYLEHRSIKGAFGHKQRQVLSLLCPQAAICIENAELYSGLEESVRQRTAELENANAELVQQRVQLARARDVAENAAKAKSSFLATMSHEIRTPMNTILGMSELMSGLNLNVQARNFLSKIRLSANHLLGIIDDILDYSRIEAGKLVLANAPFEIEDVFEQLTSIVGLKAIEKGLRLWYDLDVDLPKNLVGDARRLKQVLINLVGNSVKFTEDGHIAVGARVLNRDRKCIEVEFNVEDTGIGIETQDHAFLFESFNQADGTTTRKYGGTGLGLAISAGLVSEMNGTIRVESDPGVRTVFTFTARFDLANEDPSESDGRGDVSLDGLRVLVVHDCVGTRQLLRRYTESFGMLPQAAETLADALSLTSIAKGKGENFDSIVIGQVDDAEPFAIAQLVEAASIEGVAPRVINVSRSCRRDADVNVAAPILPRALRSALVRPDDLQSVDASEYARVRPRWENQLKRLHVLVVEDNELTCETLDLLLTAMGASVSFARNGEQALELLESRPLPDCILLDYHMPIMDGPTTAKHIRQRKEWQCLPIILLTGDAITIDNDSLREVGINDVVIKPFQADDLCDKIERLVDESDRHSRFKTGVPSSS